MINNILNILGKWCKPLGGNNEGQLLIEWLPYDYGGGIGADTTLLLTGTDITDRYIRGGVEITNTYPVMNNDYLTILQPDSTPDVYADVLGKITFADIDVSGMNTILIIGDSHIYGKNKPADVIISGVYVSDISLVVSINAYLKSLRVTTANDLSIYIAPSVPDLGKNLETITYEQARMTVYTANQLALLINQSLVTGGELKALDITDPAYNYIYANIIAAATAKGWTISEP